MNKDLRVFLPKLKVLCTAATRMNHVDLKAEEPLAVHIRNDGNHST